MIPVLAVSYRNWPALKRCIDSIETQTVLAEPWIHDNSLINLGLTKAVNKLLKIAQIQDHQYVLWVNQDVILTAECVENAVEFMDLHPRCAIAGMKQLATDEPDRITHGGCTEAYPAGRHLTGLVSRGDCNESKKMPWVNLAACIIRMEAVHEVGLFDERFFLYYQDSAWCYEAWAHDWEVWYCAECVVFHETEGCASSPNPEQLEIVRRDQTAFETWLVETNFVQRLATVGE